MTPTEFITARINAGESATAAVKALASIIRTNERQAWNLHAGRSKPTPAALLLLSIWHTCPEARACWSPSKISETKERAKSKDINN